MSPVQQLPLDEAVVLLHEAADTPPLTMREALCRVWKAATASHSLLEAHGRVFSILARLVRAIAASMVVLLGPVSS
jgi:hypothetical protein